MGKNQRRSIETIIALINKIELQKENSKLSFKRKEVKKGKFSFVTLSF
jgi:hypothetical protein